MQTEGVRLLLSRRSRDGGPRLEEEERDGGNRLATVPRRRVAGGEPEHGGATQIGGPGDQIDSRNRPGGRGEDRGFT
jgi:hypothetical protein